MAMDKEHLGDGLYANEEDGFVVLTAEDGVRVTNRVYLEHEVLENFLEYVRRFKDGRARGD